MRILTRFLALVAVLLVAVPAVAGSYKQANQYEQAREWLERMAVAMRDMSYQGTFVYVRGDDIETMRITHVNEDGVVRERLYAVSGPHREVVRDSSGVRCLLGDEEPAIKNAMATGSMFPEFAVEAFAQARTLYRFEMGDSARVAGRPGQQVRIVPRDKYRYGYDLWMEKETGLLLRWVLFDAEEKMLAKLVFTELQTGDQVDMTELEPDAARGEFINLGQAAEATPGESHSLLDPSPSGLPPGFRLAAHAVEPGEAGNNLEHWLYSDGLATVSVYIEAWDPDNGSSEGTSRMGTTHAWSKRAGPQLVTAIGEVPPVTVRRVGTAFVNLPGVR